MSRWSDAGGCFQCSICDRMADDSYLCDEHKPPTPTNPYARSVSGRDEIDVYDVLVMYGVTHPAIAHAVKKLLMAGQRGGGKDEAQDVAGGHCCAEKVGGDAMTPERIEELRQHVAFGYENESTGPSALSDLGDCLDEIERLRWMVGNHYVSRASDLHGVYCRCGKWCPTWQAHVQELRDGAT